MNRPRGQRTHAFARRVYERLLRWLPADLRTAHGDEMRETFTERSVESAERAGVRGVLLHLAREALDVCKTGLGLRRARARGGERGRRRRLQGLGLDLRHAVRLWARRPGLTALALLVIALGIGATSAIFTVVDTVLFRPLPHREPERLVMIWQTMRSLNGARVPAAYPNIADWRGEASSGFADIAAYQFLPALTVVLNGDPESLSATRVTGNLFDVLGNGARIGRTIGPADDEGGARVTVLSHALWQSRFGGDVGVLGRAIRIEGESYEVVGVMAPGFVFPRAVDFWIPLGDHPARSDRDTRFLSAIGRLAAGVTMTEAQRRLDDVMARLVQAWPENEGNGVLLQSRRDLVIGNARPAMQVLLGASALLLLLACASVANLLLARVSVRGDEIAVRGALGAERGRILVQLVAENVLLAMVGGLLGLLVAWAGTKLLVHVAPVSLPRRDAIALDARSVAFCSAMTLLTGFAFGLVPALRASARDAGDVLRQGLRGTASASRQRLLHGLVVIQIATAVVLLVGGGLLVRSFVGLSSVDPGFRAAGVFTMRVALPPDRYDRPRVQQFFAGLVEAARTLPGVDAAGATWALPFSGDFASGRVTVEGDPRPTGEELTIGTIPIAGDYFETMGMRVRNGRTFTSADFTDSSYIAIINETAARMFWPDGAAVGRRFKRGAPEADVPWATVVGVVSDARRFGLASGVEPEIYWPHRLQTNWARQMSLVVRSSGDPLRLAAPLRRLVRDRDPGLAVTQTGLLSDFVAASVAEPRFRTALLAAFAAAALLLALAGIYGVMAFAVTQRTREIGVRMALGADRTRVLTAVLRQGALITGLGLGLGLSGAVFSTRALESLLFGVGRTDLFTYVAVTALLAMTAVVACWSPARRASRVEPVIAMRE